MRNSCAVAALLALSACAAAPEPEPTSTPTSCPDPRPQVCTMEYAPACAILADGSQKEYSSACNACADEAVTAVLAGPCPE